MQFRYILSLLACWPCLLAGAQELLSNGDFEQYSSCPSRPSQIRLCRGWMNVVMSADYFNACFDLRPGAINVFYKMGVPKNLVGLQPARSGRGYAGIAAYPSGNGYAYLAARLKRPLAKDSVYYVEFYASSQYNSISFMGCHLSATLFKSLPDHLKRLQASRPQVLNPPGRCLCGGWVKVSGTFTAQGGESYIYIGAFAPAGGHTVCKAGTAVPQMEDRTGNSINEGAYYFIDDVSVRPARDSARDYAAEAAAARLNALRSGAPVVLPQVQFEMGSSRLSPSSYPALDSLAAQIRKDAGLQVEISGHTDSTGIEEKNITLSLSRAEAVAAYLISMGVPAASLQAKGYGSSQPRSPNASEAGRILNRRVEAKAAVKK